MSNCHRKLRGSTGTVVRMLSLESRPKPSEPHKLAQWLVQLENKKARYLSEARMWAMRKEAVDEKIVRICTEIEKTRSLLRDDMVPEHTPCSKPDSQRSHGSEQASCSASPTSNFYLDY